MNDYHRRQRWDRWATWVSRTVAMLVLLVVVLLIGYLLITALPVGWPSQPDVRANYPAEPGNSRLLGFNVDQSRVTRVLGNGEVLRFEPRTGVLHGQTPPIADSTDSELMVRQLFDAQQQEYLLTVDNKAHAKLWKWELDTLTDQHSWPAVFNFATDAEIQLLSVTIQQQNLLLAVQSRINDQVIVNSYVVNADSVKSDQQLVPVHSWLLDQPLTTLLLLQADRLLGVSANGSLLNLTIAQSLADDSEEALVEALQLPDTKTIVTDVYKLAGNMLLVSTATGEIKQWVELPGDNNPVMQLAASYQCGKQAPSSLVVSHNKSWFACMDHQARASLFYIGREAAVWRSDRSEAVLSLALSAQQLLLDHGDSWQYLQRDDAPVLDHKLLWQAVWYPGYQQPAFVWQPNASGPGGAKFSITPLLFGTFKAALIAILFGVPLAVLGAIYTSLILTREWRERLKPVVEMLEAMPTVIIGFLAAVWLAPYLQNHLFIGLLLLFGLPLVLVLLGFYWSIYGYRYVNKKWRSGFPVVLIALIIMLLMGVGWLVESNVFDGQLSVWLELNWGWTYDLRNALVVGAALGLAITPTIFALCEDALIAVPKQLNLGALALGASRWQAVWQVIVPCAASGLLAAILIGLGRALGETMIVLIAASNTPLIEASPLRGLQAIAPALAIEMPEADPSGLHFRVLMLCALVLFAFTLLANTLAELIRERLRRRYQV